MTYTRNASPDEEQLTVASWFCLTDTVFYVSTARRRNFFKAENTPISDILVGASYGAPSMTGRIRAFTIALKKLYWCA